MARKHQAVARRTPIVDVGPPSVSPGHRQTSKSETFFSIYTNDIMVQTSPWDVRLTLGELGDTETDGDKMIVRINQLCEVRMAPQLAKKLVLILAEQLKSYEANFGEIPGPRD